MTFPVIGLTRRELLKGCAKAALALPACNVLAAMGSCGGKSATPAPALPVSDDEFLDQIERAAFLFFWEQASPVTGQVKDRALAAGNDTRTVSSIASTGFGLTALCIGHQRGYGDASQIQGRVAATLDFLANRLPNVKGFFYHFVDMDTGARVRASELSSIDTAILLCGVLTCRQYFRDAHIQELAGQIYNRVDWPWMLNGGTAFSMGWTPEHGFLSGRWDTYSELMMIYLLGIGSTTHPVPASCWDAFSRPAFTYQGLSYVTNLNAPLFIHQYSHAWFDFRNQRDKYANYFDNSVTATRAHKLFCLSLQKQYPDYQENLWGITSSDSAHGYVAWGGPPQMGSIDGSVVPCATGGSLPFATSACIAVLRNIRSQYPLAWQRYGYVDAFNPLTHWYDPDVIGIDLGITMLMAENQRANFVWNTFMRNVEVQSAFAQVFAGNSGQSVKPTKTRGNR
jgi:hypothetical protein